MCLFIAVNFEESVKNQIENLIECLRPHALQGYFVRKEKLHLILEFLGKVEKEALPVLTKILSSLSHVKFTLKLNRTDSFKGRRGNNYWLGRAENATLMHL